jgi:hypothetical protein
MDLSNSAARPATSAVAIAPSHHHRPRVRYLLIDARMPQLDRAPAGGGCGADQSQKRVKRTMKKRFGEEHITRVLKEAVTSGTVVISMSTMLNTQSVPCRARAELKLGVPGMCGAATGKGVGKRCTWLIYQPL